MTVNPLVRVRHDHCSITVPQLDDAVRFFVDVLGAEELYRRSIPAGADRRAMVDNFNAHPDAAVRLAKLRIGGIDLELFEYSAPDAPSTVARNCDPGGSHLAFAVDDIDGAVRELAGVDGVTLLGGVSELPPAHPLAGRRWIYLLTPWGQQLELVDDRLRRPVPIR